MEENIKPIKIDNIDNKKQNKDLKKDEKGFIRLDSPINDNESNIILFKYGPSSNSKENIKINNDKKNNNIISHDKEIMEDSIIYFSLKLKKNNNEYHNFLYVSIFLYIFDIIIWHFDKQILHTNLNLYSILLILGMSIFQVYFFKHNFETISKEIYFLVQRVIYIYSFSLFLFYSDILYTIFQIIINKRDNNIIYQKKIINFFGFPLIIFFYIIVNLLIPIFILYELIKIKRNIKNLSAAKGETYENVKIKDSQIINSIIN